MSEAGNHTSGEKDTQQLSDALRSTVQEIFGEKMSPEESRHHFIGGLVRGTLIGLAPSFVAGSFAAGSTPEPKYKLPVFIGVTMAGLVTSGVIGGTSGMRQAEDARSKFAQQLKDKISEKLQKRD